MYIQLNEFDIQNLDINLYKIIYVDEYLKSENDTIDYSNYYLFIHYNRTNIISYNYIYNDLYTDDETTDKINKKILNFNGKKILIIHDIHDYTFKDGYNSFYNYLEMFNIDLVIGNYMYNKEYEIINSIVNKLNKKICTIPNLVDSNVFRNYDQEKIYDILIYGMIADCYVLRKRLLDIIKNNKENWKIRIIEYNEMDGVELSKEINKSYLSIATSSIYEYFVFKYIEISLSQSLVIGDMPLQGKKLFDDNNFININNDMTDDEIINIINITLNDKKSILEKINMFNSKLEFYKSKYLIFYHVKAINYLLDV